WIGFFIPLLSPAALNLQCHSGAIDQACPPRRLEFFMDSDVKVPNKDLRNGYPSVCSLDHFVAALPIAADVNLSERNSLSLQQRFCRSAVGAIKRRIDPNLFHFTIA